MLYRDIFRTLAFYLWIFLLPLSIPLFMAIYCDWMAHPAEFPHSTTTLPFLVTFLITALLGGIFFLWGQKGRRQLYRREALLLVLMIYFLTPALGGLPFYLSKTLKNPLDCYFESVSALTTTGASILFPKNYDPETGLEIPYRKTVTVGDRQTHYLFYGTVSPTTDSTTQQKKIGIEAVAAPLLFWRSFMQWLGGGGIIVLFVAILPTLGVGGKFLFQTEVTGPSKESMLPRIKETANQLWRIYLSLTIAEIIILMATNKQIPFFDAILLSFSTLSTGGFTPRNLGVAAYNSLATECVLMLFMLLGSMNFSLFFYCIHGRFARLKDRELLLFLAIIALSCLFAAWQLTSTPETPLETSSPSNHLFNFWRALRYGSFQIISAQTSTGFATSNYDLWPFSIQALMVILMYVGGMASSTAGGLKVIRMQTLFRTMLNKIEAIYRPDAVRMTRIGNTVIDDRGVMTVMCLILIGATFAILGTFLFILDGVDPQTGLTTVACMANNAGMAYHICGPLESFAFLSSWGKILSCIWMIAGRLEYYALLIALIPAFWRSSY